MIEIISSNLKNEPIYLALGFFDCVHFGHRALINSVIENAKLKKCKSAVFTFSNNAYKQFNSFAKLIYTFEERVEILSDLGIDYILPFKFDKNLKNMNREEFLKMLISKFNIVGFICGYDYLFGSCGKGDANYLDEFCKLNNIELQIVPPITIDGHRVSSTLVKEMLIAGSIKNANKLLVSPYRITGRVTKGRGVGKTFGFPTANIELPLDKQKIGEGVYGTYTKINNKLYKSITNVGSKPTFDEFSFTIECLVDGLEFDIYDKIIEVYFYKKIRDIIKFNSPQELAAQIKKDSHWEKDND